MSGLPTLRKSSDKSKKQSKPVHRYEVDLSNYKKQQLLKNGAFGYVYQVEDKQTGKNYAAKVIDCQNDEDECNKVINREVEIMLSTYHKTIINLIGFSKYDFDHQKNVTIIMDLANNGSLRNLLQKMKDGTNINNTTRQIILAGIARGMKYLYDRSIIHWDLKPENVLISDNYEPIITDFGLSKEFEFGKSNQQSQFCGTPFYMAPEILREEEYDRKADVYSFSIIMFEVVTGKDPFPKMNYRVLSKIMNDNHRPEFDDSINKNIRELIESCWSDDPDDRPSFKEIFQKLSNQNDSEEKNYLLDNVDMRKFNKYIDEITNNFDPVENLVKEIDSYEKEIKKLKAENIKMRAEKNQLKKQISEKTDSDEVDCYINMISALVNHCNLNSDLISTSKQQTAGDALINVAVNLIEKKIDFKKNVEIGIKYLERETKKSNIKAMEIYGYLLLEGKNIPKNETKGMELLNRAINKFNSTNAKFLLAKYIISKEDFFDDDDDDDKINYVLAKKYAKEAADNGNTKAMILYGELCHKRITNKYGKIEHNFAEAFKYYKMAADLGDPDGIANYSYYLFLPHGLFTPDIKKSAELSKIAHEKGSGFGSYLHAFNLLNGICFPKDLNEGWRIAKIAEERGAINIFLFYGYYHHDGIWNETKKIDKEKGLMFFKKAAQCGNFSSLYQMAKYKDEYKEEINLERIKKKLIQNCYIFGPFDENVFDKKENLLMKAAEAADKKDYEKVKNILEKLMDNYYLSAFRLYAEVWIDDLHRISEGKDVYKKAADFGNVSVIKDYVYYLESGKLGKVDPNEIKKYKEIVQIIEKSE